MIDSSTENGGRWILMIPTKLAPKHGNSGRQFAFPHHLHQKVCFIVWLAKFVVLFFPFLSHPPKKWIFGPTLPSAIQPSIRPNQWINLFVCGPKKGGGLGGEGAMEGTQTRAKSPPPLQQHQPKLGIATFLSVQWPPSSSQSQFSFPSSHQFYRNPPARRAFCPRRSFLCCFPTSSQSPSPFPSFVHCMLCYIAAAATWWSFNWKKNTKCFRSKITNYFEAKT